LRTHDLRQLRELERENAQLKKLLAERDLEIDAVRAMYRKNGLTLPNPSRERGF
jgi:putative transposase